MEKCNLQFLSLPVLDAECVPDLQHAELMGLHADCVWLLLVLLSQSEGELARVHRVHGVHEMGCQVPCCDQGCWHVIPRILVVLAVGHGQSKRLLLPQRFFLCQQTLEVCNPDLT